MNICNINNTWNIIMKKKHKRNYKITLSFLYIANIYMENLFFIPDKNTAVTNQTISDHTEKG